MQPTLVIQGVEYTLCGTIGEGGAGRVSLARDGKGRFYAIKMVWNYNNPITKQLVDNEIRIQKMFQGNPHVIQYIAEEYERKVAYIVLEIGACSLRNVIEHKKIREKEFLCIVCDMCQGLTQIHAKQVIHRDIKPENIIYKDGIYKITDFGVSCSKNQDDSSIGTLPYMAPEIIFEDSQFFTNKVDVWSMGVTVFQVLFNVHPFLNSKTDNFREAEEQLKESIKYLTKQKFTVPRFVEFLKKKQLFEKAHQVEKKMKLIRQQVLQNIGLFFERDPTKREDMNVLFMLFESLKETMPVEIYDKVKINSKISETNIPPEILMMVRALNLIYKLNAQYSFTSLEKVTFSIELAIWFLTGVTYGNVHYIIPKHLERLKKHLKSKEEVWEDVRTGIIEYYFWISENKEDLDFFESLNELKVLILMCASWNVLIEFDSKFCYRIKQITKFEIFNALEILQFLQMFSDNNFMEIENMLLNEFCM